MSRRQRLHGVKVLKAVSSTLRFNILNLLFDANALSYTELMNLLKMNPSRDAGRFAYHLKFLLKTELIEADIKSKKYRLTELGKTVIRVSEEIERKASRRRKILVRTSRFKLEDFDANKIANSLINEAKMPIELAQRVAKEARKRLLKSKIKYLTAPLIREVVNAILIEKGLEEYRHKLARLGLPVHYLTSLLKDSDDHKGSAVIYETAGKTVFREYILLDVLPRDIADAYLSGALHINGLSSWISKPSEVMHDLRFFFKNGLNCEKINIHNAFLAIPKSFESALSLVFNVLLHSAKEVDETQTLNYFNIFLSPFIKNIDPVRIKEALRLFILTLNQHIDVTLGLELIIPEFIAKKTAVGPSGQFENKYEDFFEESQLISSLILDIFSEESSLKPIFNPKIIVKIRPEAFTNKRAKAILLKAHSLAAEKSIPYFVNLKKDLTNAVFSISGSKLRADLKGDWEIETLRTGVLGSVSVNLPRLTYESNNDKAKFFELLKERLEMAVRALEIKYSILKEQGKVLLPFFKQNINGDQYFRLNYSNRLINLSGLNEAAVALFGKSIYEDSNALEFTEKLLLNILDFTKINKSHGKRIFPSILPFFTASKRFAKLDIERYGVAKVRFLGTREDPFYSTINKLNVENGALPVKPLEIEGKLQSICEGGTLTMLKLADDEVEPKELFSLTKKLFEENNLKFFTYYRNITYCESCKKSWNGLLHKCLKCESINTLRNFTRFPL